MRGWERSAAAATRSPRRSAGAATACCALLALGGCGSSHTKYIDMAKVRQSIEHSILEQRHLKSTVLCPQQEVQKPHRFACIATTISRSSPHREIKTPFLVTVLDDKGRVRYVGLKPPRQSQ